MIAGEEGEVYRMPEISRFFGIRITMYYQDHVPPHFHAEYGGYKALVDIDRARIIRGALPSNQLKLVLAWAVLHRDELLDNWERTQQSAPLKQILPLQ